MYNKTIIRFGFCDIRNYQGLGKCYQPKLKAEADNTYLLSQTPHPIVVYNFAFPELIVDSENAKHSRNQFLKFVKPP